MEDSSRQETFDRNSGNFRKAAIYRRRRSSTRSRNRLARMASARLATHQVSWLLWRGPARTKRRMNRRPKTKRTSAKYTLCVMAGLVPANSHRSAAPSKAGALVKPAHELGTRLFLLQLQRRHFAGNTEIAVVEDQRAGNAVFIKLERGRIDRRLIRQGRGGEGNRAGRGLGTYAVAVSALSGTSSA